MLYVTTEDIFIASGFDAVIMLKTIELGVQLFGPMAIVCLVIRTPCATPTACLPAAYYCCMCFRPCSLPALDLSSHEVCALQHCRLKQVMSSCLCIIPC